MSRWPRGAVRAPVILHARRQRVDVGGIVVIAGNESKRRTRCACRASAALTWSNTAPVDAPQYCGNIGIVRMSSAPALRSDGDGIGHGGAAGVEHRQCHRRVVRTQRQLRDRARSASLSMASGEPSGVQIAAYFFALARGRIRRMIPCRIGHQSTRGNSTTRGSPNNPARKARTSRVASEAGVPELTSSTPHFMTRTHDSQSRGFR